MGLLGVEGADQVDQGVLGDRGEVPGVHADVDLAAVGVDGGGSTGEGVVTSAITKSSIWIHTSLPLPHKPM